MGHAVTLHLITSGFTFILYHIYNALSLSPPSTCGDDRRRFTMRATPRQRLNNELSASRHRAKIQPAAGPQPPVSPPCRPRVRAAPAMYAVDQGRRPETKMIPRYHDIDFTRAPSDQMSHTDFRRRSSRPMMTRQPGLIRSLRYHWPAPSHACHGVIGKARAARSDDARR